MSFILRAVLVIGVLSYFAVQQRRTGMPEPIAVAAPLGAGVANVDLTGALSELPAELRDQAARAASAEVARWLGLARTSQDTLSDSDRRPSWRGPGRP